MELYPARLRRGRGAMEGGRKDGREGSEWEAPGKKDEEMKVRKREKLNEKAEDCDRRGGDGGRRHNLEAGAKFSSVCFFAMKL